LPIGQHVLVDQAALQAIPAAFFMRHKVQPASFESVPIKPQSMVGIFLIIVTSVLACILLLGGIQLFLVM